MNRNKQIEFERNEISEILAQNFELNGEKWDASDFEWSAHCVQMAGYRKASEVAREIFEEIETSLVIGSAIGSEVYYAIRAEDYIHYKKKYTESEDTE